MSTHGIIGLKIKSGPVQENCNKHLCLNIELTGGKQSRVFNRLERCGKLLNVSENEIKLSMFVFQSIMNYF